MLHERRLPQSEFEDLYKVYRVKLALLDWILRTPPVVLSNKDPLLQHFGELVGNWLWIRIRQPAKRSKFGKAVDALAKRARLNPRKALLVAKSIQHDAKFHTSWNRDNFELRFPSRYSDWLDSIADVAGPFYDWLASTGFSKNVFRLAGKPMTRSRIMLAYRPQSHGVCGYCDGPLGEVGTVAEANDCDHFFPKSQWPHLAIHPANLYSACKGCNSTWKLAKAPMGKADVLGLSETYHPMLRPGARRILITAIESPTTSRRIAIQFSDAEVPKRAETLVKTLDLEARWTNDVNERLDGGISELVAYVAHHKGRGWLPTTESVSELIQDDITWKREHLGVETKTMRFVAVLNYQLVQHIQDIVAELA
jgi:hypothetical protein